MKINGTKCFKEYNLKTFDNTCVKVGGEDMKLEVILDTKELPLHYHFLFVSLIKKAVGTVSSEKVDSLYKFEEQHNKQSKAFTFAVFMERFSKTSETFAIDGHVKWILSSSNDTFLLYVYNGLMNNRSFTYKGFTVRVRSISMKETKKIRSEKALFQTLSPIAIKSKNGEFLSIEDSSFAEEFQYICNLTVKNAVGRTLHQPLIFSPVNMKQLMVQLKHEEFCRLNAKSILYVKSFKGLFKLEGHPEDLTLLSQLGTSFRRSHGFGCIDLIKES